MAYEDNITNACGDREYMQSLNDLTGPMAVCNKYIQKAAEDIINLRHIPGKKDDAYRSMLFARADALKRTAVIYEFVFGQLECAAKKLADGVPLDEVLADVVECKMFLNNQLKSEKDSASEVANVFRKDIQDSTCPQFVDK